MNYNTRGIIGVRAAIIALLAELKRIRVYMTVSDIDSFFRGHKLTALPAYSCNQIEVSKGAEPVGFIPIVNTLEEEVTLIRSANNSRVLRIHPQEITVNLVSQMVNNGEELRVMIDDTCYNNYTVVKDGYIIIE